MADRRKIVSTRTFSWKGEIFDLPGKAGEPLAKLTNRGGRNIGNEDARSSTVLARCMARHEGQDARNEDGRSSGSSFDENVFSGRERRPQSAWNSRSGRLPQFTFTDMGATGGDDDQFCDETAKMSETSRRKSTTCGGGGCSGSTSVTSLHQPTTATRPRGSLIPVRAGRLHPGNVDDDAYDRPRRHSFTNASSDNAASTLLDLSRDQEINEKVSLPRFENSPSIWRVVTSISFYRRPAISVRARTAAAMLDLSRDQESGGKTHHFSMCENSSRRCRRSRRVMDLSRDVRDKNHAESGDVGGGEQQAEPPRRPPRAGLTTSCSEVSQTEARRRALARLASADGEPQFSPPDSERICYRTQLPRKLDPIYREDAYGDEHVFFTCK